ncbi:hypothetical protein DPMN_145026 [Dreissena polymorpha]|uniref:Uncharacterized protein n=1 Tax=Dreissena polymorpha TaxID=45954 RepID=A0A9D4J0U3_DREPO|nr:hypothetical protein DPMN_145026 [Dreissena polymorpha]
MDLFAATLDAVPSSVHDSHVERSATSGGRALPKEVSLRTTRTENSDVTEATPPKSDVAEFKDELSLAQTQYMNASGVFFVGYDVSMEWIGALVVVVRADKNVFYLVGTLSSLQSF